MDNKTYSQSQSIRREGNRKRCGREQSSNGSNLQVLDQVHQATINNKTYFNPEPYVSEPVATTFIVKE